MLKLKSFWNWYIRNYRYVKSRSDSQLRNVRDENQIGACKPEDDVGGQPIVPCGLIAWSLFNDTYDLSRNRQALVVNKTGIAWKSDRDNKFGKNVFPKNFQNGSLTGGARLNPNKSVRLLILWYSLTSFCKILDLSYGVSAE